MSDHNGTAPSGQNATAPSAQNGTANGGKGGPGGAAPAHGPGSSAPFSAELENDRLSKYLILVCGAVAVAMILWTLSNILIRYVRRVASLNNDTQRYFAIPSKKFSWFKKNLLYAPISRKRHNREIQLSSAVNIGTLPTRLQLLFIVGYFATNLAFCLVDIPFHDNFDTAASQLRNRTGVLAVVNMVR